MYLASTTVWCHGYFALFLLALLLCLGHVLLSFVYLFFPFFGKMEQAVEDMSKYLWLFAPPI